MPNSQAPLPVHRYRLRPDCTVRLDLPDDLTKGEAKRLALFVRSLVREPEWPYPVKGDNPSDDFSAHGDDDDFPDYEHKDLDADEVKAFFDQCARDEKHDPRPRRPADVAKANADFPNL